MDLLNFGKMKGALVSVNNTDYICDVECTRIENDYYLITISDYTKTYDIHYYVCNEDKIDNTSEIEHVTFNMVGITEKHDLRRVVEYVYEFSDNSTYVKRYFIFDNNNTDKTYFCEIDDDSFDLETINMSDYKNNEISLKYNDMIDYINSVESNDNMSFCCSSKSVKVLY